MPPIFHQKKTHRDYKQHRPCEYECLAKTTWWNLYRNIYAIQRQHIAQQKVHRIRDGTSQKFYQNQNQLKKNFQLVSFFSQLFYKNIHKLCIRNSFIHSAFFFLAKTIWNAPWSVSNLSINYFILNDFILFKKINSPSCPLGLMAASIHYNGIHK